MAFISTQINSYPRLKASNDAVNLPETRLVLGGVTAAHKWSITKDLTETSNHRDFNVRSRLDKLCMKYGQQIKDIKHVMSSVEDPLQSLLLVDATQRLGIDYHFHEEIEAFLERQFMEVKLRNHEYQSLFEVSLCFRLLRQQGHYVPTDLFNDFKNKEGIFDDILRQDIRGLMELYEASQLNIEGEDVLLEAANFSRKILNESLEHLQENKAKKVKNTLKHPYHKSLSKFMAKSFLKDFKGTYKLIKPLQELARMEFMVAQQMHRHELSQISKWWKDLKVTMDLKLARDQPLKWYTWTMASLTDTSLSELRIELTKAISFIYIIDDIFDIYGTLDELTLFTEAIKRWDTGEIEQLPDYMKMCLKALHDLTNEIGYKIYKKYGHNPTYFLRKAWKSLCDAFLREAKWFASKEIPKADEYLKVARVSSGMHVVLVHTFFLSGLGATNESKICLNDIEGLTSSIATILRLYDDLGSAKDENQNGNDGSYIDCYIQEYGVTIDVARQHVHNMLSREWQILNKENLLLTKYSASFTKASLNLARMVPLMYTYDDDQCLPLIERHIKSVFNDDSSLELIS